MSFKKVFVAVDGSAQGAVVFEQAVELATKDLANLMVFHAVELGARMTYPSQIEAKTEEGQDVLQGYREKTKDLGISVEFDCRVGNPGSAICDAAKEWGADLIVLGRRGYKGITEVLLGSVSNHVVRNAHCSVLIIQGDLGS
ncbi:universal stress protein [Scytonema millei]|uniref:Universal stress protein n=1 Tax=Scytonema millei VB511283 TaxID=1245923 RepID=A0A9X5E2Q5_9CYAN|nr:universal stress protein [Scytonema millei]NHC34071.1 universal stress protein [Scytonema millei VB511283]